MQTPEKSNIIVAISSCLLGHPVRYDGQHKKHNALTHQVCNTFTCIAVCPEQAIGLGVPRQPIHLIRRENQTRAIGVYTPELDVTNRLKAYAACAVDSLYHISGYIFKARSPSCGLVDVPLSEPSTITDSQIMNTGIFSAEIQKHFPGLPVADENHLSDQPQIERFMARVVEFANANTKLKHVG